MAGTGLSQLITGVVVIASTVIALEMLYAINISMFPQT